MAPSRSQSLIFSAAGFAVPSVGFLAGIGRELQWNRSAARGALDASDAHYMVARLATVAFERHGFELAKIAPGGEPVFKHCSTVGTIREGIRIVAGMPGWEEEKNLGRQWIGLSSQARVEVSNPATRALKTLGCRWNRNTAPIV